MSVKENLIPVGDGRYIGYSNDRAGYFLVDDEGEVVEYLAAGPLEMTAPEFIALLIAKLKIDGDVLRVLPEGVLKSTDRDRR